MIKSEQLDMLAPALSRAQNQIRSIAHDSINPNFESGFTSLQAVIKATLPVLESNQLAISQAFDGGDDETINIETFLIHGSGQFIGSRLRIPARPIKRKNEKEAGPINAQSVGSAITYGRRYALVSLLGIATDKDDDGNSASRFYERDTIPDRTQKPTPAAELPTYEQTEDNEFGGEEPAKLDQIGKLRTYSSVPICKPIITSVLKHLGYGSFEQMTMEEADRCLEQCQDAMNGPAEEEPAKPAKTKKTCPARLKYLEKWLSGHEKRVNEFLVGKGIEAGQTWRDLDEDSINRLANGPDQFAAAADIPEHTNTPY